MSLGKKNKPSDDDFEMRDAEGSTRLSSPFITPKQTFSQRGAPENSWAAQMNPEMFAFGNSPARPRAKTQSPVTLDDEVGEDAEASPNTTVQTPSGVPRPHRIPLNSPMPDGFIRASGSRPGDQVALGEAVHWNFHSLEAIRVASGFVDTHLNDLVWFHERAVDHHANLVRTRNLVRKVLDGVARAAHSREQLDELTTTGTQDQGKAE